MVLNYVPSIPTLIGVFIINGCSILLNAFFCIYWDDHVFFDFSFVKVVYDIHWFAYIEPSLWTWGKFHLVVVWCMIFLICWWIRSAKILMRTFASVFVKVIGLYFFFTLSLSILVLGGWWLHRMSLCVFLLLQPFEKFWEDWV